MKNKKPGLVISILKIMSIPKKKKKKKKEEGDTQTNVEKYLESQGSEKERE